MLTIETSTFKPTRGYVKNPQIKNLIFEYFMTYLPSPLSLHKEKTDVDGAEQ